MKKLLIITVLLLFAGIAFGQTLKKGAVAAVQELTVTLDPDVTMNQYLDFYKNKFIPAIEKAYQGSKGFLLKGDRGQLKNKIGGIWYFESAELRDKYWDSEGQATELGTAAAEKIAPIAEELQKLGETTWKYTDWIIL